MENVKLDLIPGRVMPICHASQYDVGRVIRFNLVENDVPYVLDGTETVTFGERKIDGNVVTAACTVTATKSYVDLETTEQMCACYGQNLCELKIEKGSDIIGTLNFVLDVERDPLEGGIQSESEIYNLQVQVTAMANAAVAEAMSGYDIYGAYVTEDVSGALASFTDGADDVPVKALSVEFAASQDLHGQSAPYPAGGGKNLFNVVEGTYPNIDLTLNSDGSVRLNGTATASYNFSNSYNLKAGTYTLSCPFSGTLPSTAVRVQIYNTNYSLSVGISNPDPSNTKVTFTTTDDMTVQCRIRVEGGFNYNNVILYPQLEVGENATSFAPYSNVCPITPVNSIAVTRTGKNLLAKSFEYYTGVSTDLSEYFFIKAGTYCFSFDETEAANWRFVIRMKDASGNNLSGNDYKPMSSGISWSNNANGWLNTSNITAKALTLTFVTDCYIRILFGYGDTSASTTMTKPQLELGSTATAYEAYNGVTKTLDLGADYYGGEVDKDGNINDNKDKIVIDGSQTITVTTQSYIKSDACDGFITVNDIFPRVSPINQQNGFAMCDKLSPVKQMMWNLTGYPNCMTVNQNQIHLNIANDLLGITDYTQETTATVKAKIKSFLESNPITVIFLKAPATAQASNAIDFNTLLGDNNFFSDAGDVDVTYRADTALYIDKRLNA